MKKKAGQTPAELTKKPEDKDPFRKKQQRAVSGEEFKEKPELEKKIRCASIEAMKVEEAIEDYIEKKAKQKPAIKKG